MADEKYGIDKLEEIIKFVFDIKKVISEDLADSKFSLVEIFGLVPKLAVIQEWVANKEEIINQAKDISIDEVKQLVGSVEGEIDNKKILTVIQTGLDTAVTVIALIKAIKDLSEPTATV